LDSVLAVEGLSKTFRRGAERVRALSGVSFSLDRGEVAGLVGPSGSGKTTLLNILCGWESADAGTVAILGRPDTQPDGFTWSEVAILPQDLALLDELPIDENVLLPIRLGAHLSAGGADVSSLLEELGLTDLAKRPPSEASLGEQQRAAFARAVVLHPDLVFIDEPTAHQDEGWTKVVMAVLRSLADGGTTCLVSTNDSDAMDFLDRTLTLRDGRLVGTVG
jgi:putative ABC transport system ATP-binding protein